jgi:deoxyribodipyrimidine photo-lyase
MKSDLVDQRRVRILRGGDADAKGPVLYWMNRELRAQDNWSLLHAAELARKAESPLGVVYNLDPSFLGGGMRQLVFKLEGLKELEAELAALNIPLHITVESGVEGVIALIRKLKCPVVVTDFFPLRKPRKWLADLLGSVHCAVHEVDAHNIVPCWLASPKQEYAAATFRPKIHRLLPEFLTDFPKLTKCEYRWPHPVPAIPWDAIRKNSGADPSVTPVGIPSGTKAGLKTLRHFIREKLASYDERRNDPSQDGQSDLSPYFHYGFVAPQRAALDVSRLDDAVKAQEAFIEELVVRRELADNFCHYCPHYDAVAGFHAWARKTLDEHRADPRPYLYTPKQFEDAKTHDPIWNAAQKEMTEHGKMHGYMRMYWAKKILEWTKTPEDAMKIAVHLNDKYELDGRDPNGYTGIAWAIGGVHDRPWGERAVFGMIRYMTDGGLKRKFDTDAYVNKTQFAGRTL